MPIKNKTNLTSKTDWSKVKRDFESDAPIVFNAKDELYDPNDEKAVAKAWREGSVTLGVRGRQKAPKKVPVSLRLSPDVVEHFKATGAGWQGRIDAALMSIMRDAPPHFLSGTPAAPGAAMKRRATKADATAVRQRPSRTAKKK